MSWKIKDNEVVVSADYEWMPIDENTPRGVRLLAINKERGGRPTVTELKHREVWFDMWQALPRYPD